MKWSLFFQWSKGSGPAHSTQPLLAPSPPPRTSAEQTARQTLSSGLQQPLTGSSCGFAGGKPQGAQCTFLPGCSLLGLPTPRTVAGNEGRERRSSSFGCDKGTQVSPAKGRGRGCRGCSLRAPDSSQGNGVRTRVYRSPEVRLRPLGLQNPRAAPAGSRCGSPAPGSGGAVLRSAPRAPVRMAPSPTADPGVSCPRYPRL